MRTVIGYRFVFRPFQSSTPCLQCIPWFRRDYVHATDYTEDKERTEHAKHERHG